MPKTNGVQLYDILPDGSLNGAYINLDTNEVLNEISRKIDSSNSIEGVYLNMYFNRDHPSQDIEKCTGTLIIDPPINGKYKLTWINENAGIDWHGEGWIIKANQMIITYWK